MMENNIQDEEVSSSSKFSSGSSSDLSFLNGSESSSASSIGADNLFDFSSEDETEPPVRRERVCIKNYCETVVQEYSDREFILQFRLERATVNQLIIRYSQSPHCITLNSGGRPPIPPHKQIYCFLWFVGHQVSSYDEVKDKFDVSKSALYKIISKVSDFLGDIAAEYINWPSEEEAEITKQFYKQKYNFDGVIALLDGTHFKIDRPPKQQDHYYNRHDFFSLQAQIVCDHKHKILDFHLGYPGSVHDARVFKNSPLYEKVTTTNLGNGYIFGDSAYPCLRQLMTPYKNNGHLQRKHRKFNKKLSQCRVSVENTIGQLKQRFRMLYHVRFKPGMKRLKVIRACIVLHNMCTEETLEILEPQITESPEGIRPARNDDEESDSSTSDDDFEEDFNQDGFDIRDTLCNLVANQS